MGPPRDVTDLPEGGVHLSMGNPHVVLFADDLGTAPVHTVGAALDREWIGGTNVEFAVVHSPGAVAMRVWERGVGETFSCGTGACAVAVASHLRGRTGRVVSVTLPGGVLDVAWDDTVWLTGPAVLVGDGEIRDEWLEGA
jgi:diaminopimelate epimerase